MQKLNIYVVSFLMVVAGCSITYIIVHEQSTQERVKMGYVNSSLLFDSFDLTKERKREWSIEESHIRSQLDSLKHILNTIEMNYQQGEIPEEQYKEHYQMIYNRYTAIEHHYTEQSEHVVQEFDDQILKRLNQYILEYGKKKGYDIILGTGSGNVLHAKEGLDITLQVTDYANKKYAGE